MRYFIFKQHQKKKYTYTIHGLLIYNKQHKWREDVQSLGVMEMDVVTWTEGLSMPVWDVLRFFVMFICVIVEM